MKVDTEGMGAACVQHGNFGSAGLHVADLHHPVARRAFRGGVGWGEGWPQQGGWVGGGGGSISHPPSSESGCLSLLTRGELFLLGL